MGSKPFSLDTKDLLKILKNAAFVGSAAGLTYVIQNLSHIDMGSAIVALVPIVTTVLSAAATWLNDNSKNDK